MGSASLTHPTVFVAKWLRVRWVSWVEGDGWRFAYPPFGVRCEAVESAMGERG